MILHIASDLHLEMRTPAAINGILDTMYPKGSEVLILAGDIGYPKHVTHAFRVLAERYAYVVYVAGNHEYYRSSPTETEEQLYEAACRHSNVYWLRDGTPTTIAGRRFLGGTLWFRDSPNNIFFENALNDFSMIEGFKPWVYKQNEILDLTLHKEVREDDIVVTHHLPSHRSVHPRYRGSELNRFFVHPMDDVIIEKKPAVWIHGHTHDRCDYMHENTMVACNPLGYPNENRGRFKPMVMELL